MFLNRQLSPADIDLGRAGTEALAHRGPDDDGAWIDQRAGVFIGHRRLTVIDLTSASAQPMQRGDTVLAFNGEIYNYKTLRGELKGKGHQFRSTGDAEVLLNGWREWNTRVVDKLDGMYAFVVWDGRQANVAVDPFGEKPIYYLETEDGVYLSSELGPLVALLGLSPDLTPELLTAYLALGFVPAPATGVAGVKRLPAATRARISDGAFVEHCRYWQPPFGEIKRGKPRRLAEGDLDKIETVLAESISDRVHADVPVCAFLSSGTDSTLIVALLRNHFDFRIPCITVAFPSGRAVNEAPHARRIARHLGLSHETLESGVDIDGAAPDAVLDLFNQPNDNITILSVREMCRLARNNYKVGVTGTGGDELFFGYRKHALSYKLRRWCGWSESLRVVAGDVARACETLHPRFRLYADLVGVRDWELYIAQKNNGAIRWLRSLPGWNHWASRQFERNERAIELLGPVHDLVCGLPDSLLLTLDHGSMRESLELRCPFLSRRLIELLAEYDPRSFLEFGRKSILSRLLARHLPEQLRNPNKHGFMFPTDRFLSAGGQHAPTVPHLEASQIATAWQHRGEGDVWPRLAVRLVMADRHFAGCASAVG